MPEKDFFFAIKLIFFFEFQVNCKTYEARNACLQKRTNLS